MAEQPDLICIPNVPEPDFDNNSSVTSNAPLIENGGLELPQPSETPELTQKQKRKFTHLFTDSDYDTILQLKIGKMQLSEIHDKVARARFRRKSQNIDLQNDGI